MRANALHGERELRLGGPNPLASLRIATWIVGRTPLAPAASNVASRGGTTPRSLPGCLGTTWK
jgi:hypothetical protein